MIVRDNESNKSNEIVNIQKNNTNYRKEKYFTSHGIGIHVFGAHPLTNVFAYTENIPKPALFIVQYPDFFIINTIQGF